MRKCHLISALVLEAGVIILQHHCHSTIVWPLLRVRMAADGNVFLIGVLRFWGFFGGGVLVVFFLFVCLVFIWLVGLFVFF